MQTREYYSIRTGKNPSGKKYSLDVLLRLLKDSYLKFRRDGYFDEYFGFHCVDDGDNPGKLGFDVGAQVFRAIKKDNIYPFEEHFLKYSEDDLFDVTEFLFDCISKPIDGFYHSWNNCGQHWNTFDKLEGEKEFRGVVNEVLADYSDGFLLNEKGEILIAGDDGLKEIFAAVVKTDNPENIDNKISAAISRFRRHRSSIEERKNAVRELVDVLEFLKSDVKGILDKKDESDLFNIANNFGIRHHNKSQKTNYDENIWLSWMFYFYLSTIYACIKLLENEKLIAKDFLGETK